MGVGPGGGEGAGALMHAPPLHAHAPLPIIAQNTIKKYGYTLRDVFDAFDTSGTGSLSKKEFTAGLEKLCPNLKLEPDDLDRVFAHFHSKTYSIAYPAFVQRLRLTPEVTRKVSTMKSMRESVEPQIHELREAMLASKPTVEEVFAFFDSTESDYISKKELRLGLIALDLGGPLGPSKVRDRASPVSHWFPL